MFVLEYFAGPCVQLDPHMCLDGRDNNGADWSWIYHPRTHPVPFRGGVEAGRIGEVSDWEINRVPIYLVHFRMF